MNQNMVALQHANRIRLKRAAVKRTIKAKRYAEGKELVAHHFADRAWPPEVDGMLVYDLLMAVHKMGRFKALTLLEAAGIGESVTVGGLTDRQRWSLVAVLRFASTRYRQREGMAA